ncbi:MAG: secondary thiamine-phosphate synthase enzyme YjbQ [Pseudomonadota bacterium]
MRVRTDFDTTAARQMSGTLVVETRGCATLDITAPVRDWLREAGARRGLLHAFVRHTTASLVIQENADPDVQDDLIDALARLAPADAPYRHSAEGSDDMPGHIKAMICGPSAVIPCANGPQFGTWQSLYLVEHRASGRTREVTLSFIGEA